MPFSDARLLNVLSHTFWFLPSVAACHAMRNLLAKKQNTFLPRLQSHRRGGNAGGYRRRGSAAGAWRRWTSR